MTESRQRGESSTTQEPPGVDAHAIRARFLAYFAARGHEVVPSSPLVPRNDPTLLFVNAGMVQFKDVFTGRERRPYTRATSSQRCLRAGGKHNDLDNVGFTPRHHTLFEMLGNFSFGDYFKRDAIRYAWEFLTVELKIPAERLVVSVYDGHGEDAPFDQEAYDLWAEFLPRDRIYAFGSKENFWQMGDTGPCGPCSEIHIYRQGVAPGDALREGKFGPAYEDDRYLELWNLVFMQYEKLATGKMIPLPKPCVDTGAGLERLAAVLAGEDSNYRTELLKPLVDRAKLLAGVHGDQGEREPSFQVIADHARATAFLITDGVFPDKKEREYVLRRIMRRAIRHGSEVGLDEPFFHEVCVEVVRCFGDAYPELRAAAPTIVEVVKAEEQAFRRTLARGLRLVHQLLDELDTDATVFPSEAAATLYDTYGFPIDLTGIIAREHGLALDETGVSEIVRLRGDTGGILAGGGGSAVDDVYFEIERTLACDQHFVGYERTQVEARLLAIARDGRSVAELSPAAGEVIDAELVFDVTPFYAESGGQVGDTGHVAPALGEAGESPPALALEVLDTSKPTGKLHYHRVRVAGAPLRVGARFDLRVDEARREAIRRNHSATHLLHHALREVLGPHVIQKGSLVLAERLRFDFSHGRAVTDEERRRIERRVTAEVLANADSQTRVMNLDEAKREGAIGLFGEKYGAEVRVVGIGRDSVELCGGTHVRRAGDIGMLLIVSEGGVAQGVRRIEAVTGTAALEHAQRLGEVVQESSRALGAHAASEVVPRIDRLQAELKARAREADDLKRRLATGGSEADAVAEIDGIKLLTRNVGEADPKVLRQAADTLRDRLGSGVVVLGCACEGKANLLVAVTRDLQARVHAGRLVGSLAVHIEGRGGGRPDLAQAGGPRAAGIDSALAGAAEELARQLAQG